LGWCSAISAPVRSTRLAAAAQHQADIGGRLRPNLRGSCSRRTVWQEEIFAAMVRNASHVTDYFRLPSRQVVEIGRQISI
jgi:hypothetical protein